MIFLQINLNIKRIFLIFFLFGVLSSNPMIKSADALTEKTPVKEGGVGKTIAIKEEPRWYEYEPEVVTLKGTLITSTAYGPPNYGETPEKDEKVNYFVLD